MSLSLKEIYDMLITEIGILTIPRNDEFEVRSLTKISSESLRDNSGTNIGSHHKANALFKSDIYFDVAPAIKDLVDNGVIKPNGNAQGAALSMLSFLTVGKLRDEIEYIERVIQTSIMYRVALNEKLNCKDLYFRRSIMNNSHCCNRSILIFKHLHKKLVVTFIKINMHYIFYDILCKNCEIHKLGGWDFLSIADKLFVEKTQANRITFVKELMEEPM